MENEEMFAQLDTPQCPPPGGYGPGDDGFEPIFPAPREPTADEFKHPKLGTPTTIYPYRDKTGRILGYVCRWDIEENGKRRKEIRPLRYGKRNGHEGYHWKGWKGDAMRPLYNLDLLDASPHASVLIVEGEKAADAALELFPEYAVTTAMNGAESAHRTDYSPLDGKSVLIWRDNDSAGTKYEAVVAKNTLAAGAVSAKVVTPPKEFEEGWDLADSLPPGYDRAALRRLLECAKPYRNIDEDGPDMSILERGIRQAPVFPIDVLGPWAPHIKALAESSSTPVDYSATALLAVTATLIGTSCLASPWEEWSEPIALWIADVGEPSSGKSPAIEPFKKELRNFEQEDEAVYEVEHQAWESAAAISSEKREVWKIRVKEAVKKRVEPEAQPADAYDPPEPTRPRLIVSDTTPEALAKVLVGQPGVLAFRDELAGLLSFDRYSAADGAGRAFWLEAFGGRSFTVDRVKNGAPIVIPRLLVSILGGIQPDRLASTLLAGADDGLSARFLFCWPDPIPRRRPTKFVNHGVITQALRNLRNL